MSALNRATTHYLALKDLSANVALARRLPAELAYRYHALPIAEESGCLTVAMADPDDPLARSAVVSALGTTPYLVQSDPMEIDAVLAQIWSDQCLPRPKTTICSLSASAAREATPYAEAIAALLGSSLTHLQPANTGHLDLGQIADQSQRESCDLVILAAADRSALDRVLRGPADCRAVASLPTSVLVVRRPRLPLKEILLIVPEGRINELALEWSLRLALPSGATVTVLTIVPPAPAMFGRRPPMQPGLTQLLSSKTELGRDLERVTQRLAESSITGRLRLRQGPPEWQIRLEIISSDYDVIIVDAGPENRWASCLYPCLANSLLRWIDRPVLVAKGKRPAESAAPDVSGGEPSPER